MDPEERSALGEKSNDTLLVAIKGLGGESGSDPASSLPVDLRYHDPRSATSLSIMRANLSGSRGPV
jgi:hypothetical protein